ncbi:unnamed protein product [Gongylonema pulchrum]|uniref:Glycogen phosphorylase n=1 Tax=Gongylonema pulchrum TaxID=637853 RepID=A0A183EW80_9BILA|nr:unnamed protein product [Gongylonema pulchrum]
MRTALRVYDALRSDAAVFPVITGKDVQNIRAIAVDHQNTAVFWSDDVKDAVTKVYLNGTSGEKTKSRTVMDWQWIRKQEYCTSRAGLTVRNMLLYRWQMLTDYIDKGLLVA